MCSQCSSRAAGIDLTPPNPPSAPPPIHSPVFAESVTAAVPGGTALRVAVFDADDDEKLNEDDCLGSAVFAAAAQSGEQTAPLVDAGGKQENDGKSVVTVAFADADADGGAAADAAEVTDKQSAAAPAAAAAAGEGEGEGGAKLAEKQKQQQQQQQTQQQQKQEASSRAPAMVAETPAGKKRLQERGAAGRNAAARAAAEKEADEALAAESDAVRARQRFGLMRAHEPAGSARDKMVKVKTTVTMDVAVVNLPTRVDAVMASYALQPERGKGYYYQAQTESQAGVRDAAFSTPLVFEREQTGMLLKLCVYDAQKDGTIEADHMVGVAKLDLDAALQTTIRSGKAIVSFPLLARRGQPPLPGSAAVNVRFTCSPSILPPPIPDEFHASECSALLCVCVCVCVVFVRVC